ncbi:leukocyte surface antigen CD47 isoform X1 [Lepisosteus oculatus]|uniref:leukocyte surface antigen CD47 isoform X1 n=1 Tax=Lepisosteus oculatus TaxID=7918 RepID=UPI0037193D44
MMSLAIFVSLLSLMLLHSGQAQLIITKEAQNGTYCSAALLKCIVTNLRQNKIQNMVLIWKLNNEEIYGFNGEDGKERKLDSVGPQVDLKALAHGNASIWLKSPKPGNYTCYVLEGSSEGSGVFKFTEVWDNYTFPRPQAVVLYVVFAAVTVVLVLQILFYHLGGYDQKAKAYCLGVFSIVLIIVGLSLFSKGVSDGVTGNSNIGFVITVFSMVVVLISQAFYWFKGIAASNKAKYYLPLYSTIPMKVVGFVISLVGFGIWVSNVLSATAPDCGLLEISANIALSGVVIFAIAEIVEFIFWYCFKGQTKSESEKSNPKESAPLSTTESK